MWNAEDQIGNVWYDPDRQKLVDFVTSSNRGRDEHLLGNAPASEDYHVLPDPDYVPNMVWEGVPPKHGLAVPY